ncbi:MAG: hypothetical protein K6U74_03825 [Firmicutes bacterium]|nr:hypothetical protein [Bacillota bacterium]
MFPSLDFLFRKGIGSRTVVIMESFPFFMTGKLIGKEADIVIIEAQEGIPVQLVGRIFHISLANLAAFFIENKEFPIPVLESVGDIQIKENKHDSDLNKAVEEVKEVLNKAVGEIKEILDGAVGEMKGMFNEADGEMKEALNEAEIKITDIERRHIGRDILFVLRPRQLSILGQVFRPIIVARLEKIGLDFVFLKDVNIRFSNAPDFIFPLPLFVPRQQIAIFLPFERQTQFPLV